jgi:hypothetical protein
MATCRMSCRGKSVGAYMPFAEAWAFRRKSSLTAPPYIGITLAVLNAARGTSVLVLSNVLQLRSTSLSRSSSSPFATEGIVEA